MDQKDILLEKVKTENHLLREENNSLKREISLLKEVKIENDYLTEECNRLIKKIIDLEDN